MRKSVLVLVAALLAVAPLFADNDKEQERLQDAGNVLKEVLNIPEGIPQNLLDKAECVVVLPSVKKLALGIGGSYGRGAMSCRSGANFTGPWSVPVMMALEGGSWGAQIGGESSDLVLLLMSPKSARSVLSSKVKLGVTASAAAGPKGREASAATDAKFNAEILTYSRSKGLFAGIALDGSTLRADNGANENLYGKKVSARRLIQQPGPGAAKSGETFISELNTHAARNQSDPNSLK